MKTARLICTLGLICAMFSHSFSHDIRRRDVFDKLFRFGRLTSRGSNNNRIRGWSMQGSQRKSLNFPLFSKFNKGSTQPSSSYGVPNTPSTSYGAPSNDNSFGGKGGKGFNIFGIFGGIKGGKGQKGGNGGGGGKYPAAMSSSYGGGTGGGQMKSKGLLGNIFNIFGGGKNLFSFKGLFGNKGGLFNKGNSGGGSGGSYGGSGGGSYGGGGGGSYGGGGGGSYSGGGGGGSYGSGSGGGSYGGGDGGSFGSGGGGSYGGGGGVSYSGGGNTGAGSNYGGNAMSYGGGSTHNQNNGFVSSYNDLNTGSQSNSNGGYGDFSTTFDDGNSLTFENSYINNQLGAATSNAGYQDFQQVTDASAGYGDYSVANSASNQNSNGFENSNFLQQGGSVDGSYDLTQGTAVFGNNQNSAPSYSGFDQNSQTLGSTNFNQISGSSGYGDLSTVVQSSYNTAGVQQSNTVPADASNVDVSGACVACSGFQWEPVGGNQQFGDNNNLATAGGYQQNQITYQAPISNNVDSTFTGNVQNYGAHASNSNSQGIGIIQPRDPFNTIPTQQYQNVQQSVSPTITSQGYGAPRPSDQIPVDQAQRIVAQQSYTGPAVNSVWSQQPQQQQQQIQLSNIQQSLPSVASSQNYGAPRPSDQIPAEQANRIVAQQLYAAPSNAISGFNNVQQGYSEPKPIVQPTFNQQSVANSQGISQVYSPALQSSGAQFSAAQVGGIVGQQSYSSATLIGTGSGGSGGQQNYGPPRPRDQIQLGQASIQQQYPVGNGAWSSVPAVAAPSLQSYGTLRPATIADGPRYQTEAEAPNGGGFVGTVSSDQIRGVINTGTSTGQSDQPTVQQQILSTLADSAGDETRLSNSKGTASYQSYDNLQTQQQTTKTPTVLPLAGAVSQTSSDVNPTPTTDQIASAEAVLSQALEASTSTSADSGSGSGSGSETAASPAENMPADTTTIETAVREREDRS